MHSSALVMSCMTPVEEIRHDTITISSSARMCVVCCEYLAHASESGAEAVCVCARACVCGWGGAGRAAGRAVGLGEAGWVGVGRGGVGGKRLHVF